jgi:hypothetical protein
VPVLLLGRGTLRGTHLRTVPRRQPPNRRSDGTFLPDFQGVIETDDGAEILFDYRGYGRAYPAGRRQIVVNATHLSEDERYRWLNDSLSVGVGEVRSQEGGPTELVIEWAELVWEPISD